jgi:hypothetical protein
MVTSTYNSYKISPHMSKVLLEECDERRQKYVNALTNELFTLADQDPDFLLNPIPEKYNQKDLPAAVLLNYFLVQMQPLSPTDDQFIN